MRLDVYLAEKKLAVSRTKAIDLIKNEKVYVNSKIEKKPSYDVSNEDIVEISGEIPKYVSRAAYKLLYAKDCFKINFKGLTAVDLGASTGGFCQVMLEAGINEIFAVDIGHGQLHESVSGDKRVHVFEKTNARYIDTDIIGKKVDVVTADLSFISQTLVLEAITRILKTGGIYIGLIKPQFEAGRANIGKHGVVKDKRVHADVIEKVILHANSIGLVCKNIAPSPILGGDGNREFLACFINEGTPGVIFDRHEIERVVNEGGEYDKQRCHNSERI